MLVVSSDAKQQYNLSLSDDIDWRPKRCATLSSLAGPAGPAELARPAGPRRSP